MNQLSPTEAAYLAGLIDGEGCIYIQKGTRTRHALIVKMAMVHRGVIDRVQAMVGAGSVTTSKRADYKPTHRQAYQWGLASQQAAEFLRQILPFMIVKRPEAELALEFMERGQFIYSSRFGKRVPVPPEVLEIRESYRTQLQQLKRGINA